MNEKYKKERQIGEAFSRQEDKVPQTEIVTQDILDAFHLTVDELRDGLVLDLGSGTLEGLSRELAPYGVKVFSLNPKLKHPEYRDLTRSALIEDISPWQGKSVAGRGQQLPFKDGSFSKIFAVRSVATHLPPLQFQQSFQEMLRLLKDGGIAYLGQVSEDINLSELQSLYPECEIVEGTFQGMKMASVHKKERTAHYQNGK